MLISNIFPSKDPFRNAQNEHCEDDVKEGESTDEESLAGQSKGNDSELTVRITIITKEL